MSNSSLSEADREEYLLAYEQTRSFLHQTLQECWWAEREAYEEIEEGGVRDPNTVVLPSPLTPSVCSTSVKFLRRFPMGVATVGDSGASRTATVSRVPAFHSMHSPLEQQDRSSSTRRRDSTNSVARRWNTYAPIASGEAILTSTASGSFANHQGLGHSQSTDSASSWLEDVYSTWNHDMAQVMMTTKAQHGSRTSSTQRLWLQPPIAGLPGGWSSANIVHATHIALEQYVQQATDLYQVASISSSSSPSRTNQDETFDTIIYTLIHFILHGTFPSSSNTLSQDSQFAQTHASLQALGEAMPRKVCQHPFKKNELVWVCRTCQSDETCVLCHSCYQRSCHEGHDVSFYHAQAGGCCDCGDPEAWDPKGFCHLHGGSGNSGDDDSTWKRNSNLEVRCGGVVKACSEWLMTHIAYQVEEAYARANPETARSSKLCMESDETGRVRDESSTTRTTRSDSLPSERRGKRASNMTISHDDSGPDTANLGRESMTQPAFRKLHSVDGSTHVTSSSTLDDRIVASNMDDSSEQNTNGTPSETMSIQYRGLLQSDLLDHQDQISFNPEAASTSKSRLGSNMPSDDAFESPGGGEDLSQQIFLSDAAGSSKGRSATTPVSGSGSTTPAQSLGWLGSEQNGLYIVVHADDIHPMNDITTTLRNLYSSSMTPGTIGSKYQSSHYYLLDPILSKIARLLKASGDVILYGTHELMAELGPVLSQCWKDGDNSACARFGALILEKAKILTQAGFVVSIKTRLELYNEVRAKAVIKLLSLLSESCDPLCLQVSLGLSGQYPFSGLNSNEPVQMGGCLTQMLLGDLKLPRMITIPWHSLLLLLLSNPVFKRELANSYCDVYSIVSNEYAKGIGLQDMSCFILSVQFLNRASFVQSLVRDRDLITVICRCLLDMLSLALNRTNGNSENRRYYDDLDSYYSADLFGDSTFNPWRLPPTAAATDLALGRRNTSHQAYLDEDVTGASVRGRSLHRLDPMHPVLSSKRYIPCISDFKYVLNVKGMARIFASLPINRSKSVQLRRKYIPSLDAFLEALTMAQYMDEQQWRKMEEGHVENEVRSWIVAFNASISLGSLSERLLHWDDDDPIPLADGKQASVTFLSVVDLTHYVLANFIFDWMKMEIINYTSTSQRFGLSLHDCSPLYLPMSSVASSHGTLSALRALPVAQTHRWSFHFPLFRFVAFCVTEVSRRPYDHAFEPLLRKIRETEGGYKFAELFRGLIEFTTLLVSRVAQIKAGLWRRNGTSMLDQVLNYGETPFCRLFRDVDITLLQFAVLALIHSSNMIDQDCEDRQRQASFSQFIHLMINRFGVFDFVGLVQSQKPKLENGDNTSTWTYQPSNDRSSCLMLLDDFLHTLIIMVTELPSPPVKSVNEVKNTKMRLRRELIHRLTSGPKTHSELGEVIHILCMRDNEILVNEGKKINPDDAVGSSIQAILKDIATCVQGRGAIAPDEYQLDKNAWAEYDPSFFHMSSINHQVAADNRPSPEISSSSSLQPYSPPPPPAHPFFSRLRKDLTSDAAAIAIVYRILHAHLSPRNDPSEKSNRSLVYNGANMSETVLCRALHILTLGAHVWNESPAESSSSADAMDYSSGYEGSIFYQFVQQPSFRDWIDFALLRNPKDIMQDEAYTGEDTILVLLSRLGGEVPLPGKCIIRDKCLRSGAAWLCQLASKHSDVAASVLCRSDESTQHQQNEVVNKKSMDIRMNEAKQRILNKMKADIEKFTSIVESSTDPLDVDADADINDDSIMSMDEKNSSAAIPRSPDVRVPHDFCKKSTVDVSQFDESIIISSPQSNPVSVIDLPRCVICAEEDHRHDIMSGKILTFCAFIQPSTVLLGAGVVVSEERDDYDRFVGTHISLCGHAVHSSCCESYLKALTQREDRASDRADSIRKSEFKCPLCQRLSNCLVPSVEIDSEWEGSNSIPVKSIDYQSPNIDEFLRYSKWWSIRNDKGFIWDGRCSFVPSADAPSSPKRNIGKVELYRAWDVLLSPYRLLTNKRMRPKTESEIDDAFEENSDYAAINDVSSTTATDVWRRLIDVVSDMAYRADLKRLGENELTRNFGEFRHYLVEKHAFNNALLGKTQLEWPQCLSFINALSEHQRHCISREKPIARLLASIQTLTYTCCSESLELQRLLSNCTSSKLISDIQRRYGISEFTQCGRVVIYPKSIKEGRFGRLRYFLLALIRASSALHREIVQLSIGFPSTTTKASTSNEKTRAPITYPILCSNVLTHITAVICSISGTDRIPMYQDSQSNNFIQARDASVHFVALGFIAKVLQTLLSQFHLHGKNNILSNHQIRKKEEELIANLSKTQKIHDQSYIRDDWLSSCRLLLLQALGNSNNKRSDGSYKLESNHSPSLEESRFMNEFTQACQRARMNAEPFLRDALLILQLAMPPWSDQIRQTDEKLVRDGNTLETLEQLQFLIGMAPLKELLQSSLVCDIVGGWYSASKETSSLCPEFNLHYSIREVGWPLNQFMIIDHSRYPKGLIQSEISLPEPNNTVPLMGIAVPSLLRVNTGQPCLDAVPLSYTDLYAQVSDLLPTCDQCAFCFLCGQVLNAGGAGECTRHAYICGGGAGIFFLLQECVSLMIYREKAAYFHSPYVDSHGETHMSRGRPLNIDMDRYETLRGLYCGHLLRQQVISERSKSTRQTIISNYY